MTAVHEMFVEDEEVRRLSLQFERIWYINDFYESAGHWYDKDNAEVPFSDVLLAVDITEQRLTRYRELLNSLDVEQIYDDGGAVFFRKKSVGILDGYVYGIVRNPEKKLYTIAPSLDEIPLNEEGEYLVQLEDDWYLYYTYSE